MKRALLVVVSLVVVVAGAFAVWLLVGAEQPYKGYEGVEQFVEIPPGAGPASIGRRLAGGGVIRDQLSFRIVLARSGQARRLQAGEYRFDRPMTTREVIDKIARGDVFLRPITFPEGLTVRQMAEVYERDGGGSKAEFLRAAQNPAPIHDIDPAAQDLEGYLFPETYTLPRRATADQLVQRMVTAFRDVMTPDVVQRAAARGMSVRELMTLASLVEKETAKPGERPIVAAVYTNRLKIGMGMQCDPTVIYALERAGKYRRQSHSREPAVRLALQHLPLCGSAAGPDRRARSRVDRGSGITGRRALPLLREPQRWLACVLGNARRAQSQRLRVPETAESAMKLALVVPPAGC